MRVSLKDSEKSLYSGRSSRLTKVTSWVSGLEGNSASCVRASQAAIRQPRRERHEYAAGRTVGVERAASRTWGAR